MQILFETKDDGEIVGYHSVTHWRVVVRMSRMRGQTRGQTKEPYPVVQIPCPCCQGKGELTFECQRGSGCEHVADCDTCDASGWCDLQFDGEQYRFRGWPGLDLVVKVPAEVHRKVVMYAPPDPKQLDMWKGR